MTLNDFIRQWNDGTATLTVQTSGSTGKPKPITVEKSRMVASAERTCRFLGLTAADTALLCMPLDYIAGKMVVVRCLVSGMRLISVEPSSHPLKGLEEQPTFVAMVPLQVHQALQVAEERQRLMQVRNLIIGGGAIAPSLEEALRDFPHAVWSTYGMTETLSHIALRRINGAEASDFYTPMEGVETRQSPDGCLEIFAPSICPTHLKTNDIVQMAADGRSFKVLGRKDNVIDSGGIKIQIEQVEERLHGKLRGRFAITKRPHEKYGEAVVLALENNGETIEDAKAICQQCLPKYWTPKAYVMLEAIPTTETGKVARKSLEEIVRRL